jgi:membrane-bound lytic murein transglycosylase A
MILDAELPQYQGQLNFVSGPVLVQDTGGAIKGRHLDLFCGFGERSEFLAGKMKDRARVYLMVIKNDQD